MGTKPAAATNDSDDDDDDEQTEDKPFVPVQWPIPEEWNPNHDKLRDDDGRIIRD